MARSFDAKAGQKIKAMPNTKHSKNGNSKVLLSDSSASQYGKHAKIFFRFAEQNGCRRIEDAYMHAQPYIDYIVQKRFGENRSRPMCLEFVKSCTCPEMLLSFPKKTGMPW